MTEAEYDRDGKIQLWTITLGLPITSFMALVFSITIGVPGSSRAYDYWHSDPWGTLITCIIGTALATFFFGPVCYWLREPFWLYQQLPDIEKH